MFSLDNFKKDYCPFLKEPDKIVTFDPVHYHMLDLNSFDEEYKKHFPDYSHYLTGYTQKGLAYTGLSEGTIYAIFGFYQLWRGNAEFFLIPSKHINKKAMVFHKVSLKFFEYVANIMQLNRLQFTVCSRNIRAVKWAKSCKFIEEGILRKYGILGDDYIMFAKYYDKEK
tara:strand:- start:3405 stop:3911 length:507 start_codon:yes stop_codon:yes gene_type:complete